MPYAANNEISTDPIPGGIAITDAQYAQALDGVFNGKIVTIDGGFALVDPPKPEEPTEPAPDMSLGAVKDRQHTAIAIAFSIAAQDLTAGYPAAEQLTWPTQQAEALAWEADNNTPTPYLDSIAAARGIDAGEMRSLTVAQVHAFQTASAQLVGTRQKLRDEIDAAATVEEVQAITWPEPAV